MAIARHGRGPVVALRAFASQVHPVFMLPPLAASWFGAVLAREFSVSIGILHMTAMFFAVYTAHVKDGYVDFHRRDEDDDHPMTVLGCRLGLAGATVGFALALAGLWLSVGPGAALLTLPTWFVGYLHAPQFDTHPVTATLGYPLGIALALLGGYYVQTTALAVRPLAFAAVFVLLLAGVKIVDDAKDDAYDRSIGKRTVAVVLGRARARRLAGWLMVAGLLAVLVLAVDGLFPPSAPLAALAFGAVALLARRAAPGLATMVLIRGAYVFLGVLVAAVWFRPLAGAPLPDIATLGPYTYLATEVVFGAIALGLLVRARALGSAARTVVALYPIAYLWDWYTLEVGVFAIPLRTGVELVGIPIEEHVFMIVVPALVIGLHETLRGTDAGGDVHATESATGAEDTATTPTDRGERIDT
ncbi:lycopene cyclase [Halobacteriales archaeon QS_4_69_34]|nr:MAG: lycopene cyclase [Halobacteriales archaeon QS_4_69_34]